MRLPPKGLLEATHRFPGPYTFKVIGDKHDAFLARVVAAIREEMHYFSDPPYEVRESDGGRHVAITLEIYVESAEVVHRLYTRLSKVTGLRILL